jgi:hypothetical protein
METEYFYIVVRGKDGSLTTWTEMPEEPLTGERQADTEDIYSTSKMITEEVEAQSLASRVAQMVAAQLNPTTPTVSDKIKEALAERGIDPDTVTVSE